MKTHVALGSVQYTHSTAKTKQLLKMAEND